MFFLVVRVILSLNISKDNNLNFFDGVVVVHGQTVMLWARSPKANPAPSVIEREHRVVLGERDSVFALVILVSFFGSHLGPKEEGSNACCALVRWVARDFFQEPITIDFIQSPVVKRRWRRNREDRA